MRTGVDAVEQRQENLSAWISRQSLPNQANQHASCYPSQTPPTMHFYIEDSNIYLIKGIIPSVSRVFVLFIQEFRI